MKTLPLYDWDMTNSDVKKIENDVVGRFIKFLDSKKSNNKSSFVFNEDRFLKSAGKIRDSWKEKKDAIESDL